MSLFVSGCTHRCKGCFNEEAQSFDFGRPFTDAVGDVVLEALAPSHIAGLTLLGGEPMEPCNQAGLINLLKTFKQQNPEKDLMMFTGFTYEQDLLEGQRKHTPFTDEILDLVDILVDGKFIESEKDIRLKFRGSRNQRIIDMKETRKTGSVVLSQLNN